MLSVMMPGQAQTWMLPGTRAHMSGKDTLTNRGIVRMVPRLRRDPDLSTNFRPYLLNFPGCQFQVKLG